MSGAVEIFTDGACRGNPGPGGWAALLRYGGHERVISGAESHTTNNRMELLAAIEALAALKRPSEVSLTTDSQYLRQGVRHWMANWKRNGWRTAEGKPVKNADLWRRLETAAARHRVRWDWVKGHAGDIGNERADALAREGMAAFKPPARVAAGPPAAAP